MAEQNDCYRDVSGHELNSLETRKGALFFEIDRLHKLPKSSTYAQHRLKIAEKALAILNKQCCEMNTGDLDELEKALQQLGI